MVIQTESRRVVTRGKGEWGNKELLNGYRVSICEDEKVFEVIVQMVVQHSEGT